MNHYAITMPQLSDTMTEGVVVTWEKQPGDKVERGDIVATVETDKAIMDVEVFKAGYLAGPLADVGATVAVGAALGYISDTPGDIAIATELHESTVSRVTSNKYIATPRGIFELKYFFTSALPARTPGVVVSSESVRSRIRHLVGGENAGAPLSDDRIVDQLKGEGIEIARRTVAKYREAMRIPSSAERRRLGRLGLARGLPSTVSGAAIASQALAGPAD